MKSQLKQLEQLKQEILAYTPDSCSQKEEKEALLTALAEYGFTLFTREKEDIHITVGAFILSPDLQQTLMVDHLIYQSFCWTGGHADGEVDLWAVAEKEVREETGIKILWPYPKEILGIYRLPVPEHQKRGKTVKAHTHFVIAYGFIAPEKQKPAVKPDENKAVAWFPVAEIAVRCQEPHMLPIYQALYEKMVAFGVKQKAVYAKLPEALLPWYEKHRRVLPWRQNQDPYRVWVSEIMLQQTRVEAVKGYYRRFMAALPTIEALAQAEEQQLLKLWEGLGYYSRVRNLQKAARMILAEYGGVFPENYEDIRRLPGIGDYTAGAIASICFNQPKAAVDGNVLRVAARLTGDFAPMQLPVVKKKVGAWLEAVYPKDDCGAFTQSLMELGATVCLPNGAPKCDCCPMAADCLSAGTGQAALLPVKEAKKPRKIEKKTVWILQCGNKIALQQRTEPGLLAGYWEFPNLAREKTPQQALDQGKDWGVCPQNLWYATEKKHIFTHIEWHMQAYYITCQQMPAPFLWVDREKLEREIPLPSAFRMFLPPLGEHKKTEK